MFMCHPWQQYIEHLKLERLLGSWGGGTNKESS